MSGWKRIYTGPVWAVEMLKAELLREGIPACVSGAPAASWIGGRLGGLGMADLVVPDRRVIDSPGIIKEAVDLVAGIASGTPPAESLSRAQPEAPEGHDANRDQQKKRRVAR